MAVEQIPKEEIPEDVSPLMVAVLQGHIATVRMMISQGYDVMHATKTGETAMTFARRLCNQAIIDLLTTATGKQNENANINKPANYDPTFFASCRKVCADRKIMSIAKKAPSMKMSG